MFGRENLNCHDMVQYIKQVNDVMDAMEARIKELDAENEKLEDDWQKSYAEECITRHENHRFVDRIEELEDIIKVDDAIRITSLENENEHLKQLVKSLEDDHEELSVCNQRNVSELVHLKERNRELEALAAKHECGPCKHCTSIPGQEALAKDEYNTLYLDNDVLRFSSREGEDDYVLETRINFCPICGMELEHED